MKPPSRHRTQGRRQLRRGRSIRIVVKALVGDPIAKFKDGKGGEIAEKILRGRLAVIDTVDIQFRFTPSAQNDEPIIFYDVEFSGIGLGTIEINRDPYLPDQPHIFREESISLFGEEPSSPGIEFFNDKFEITLEGQQLDRFEDIIQRTEFEAVERVQRQIGRGVEPRPEEIQRMQAELLPDRLKDFVSEQLENYIFENSDSFIKLVLSALL